MLINAVLRVFLSATRPNDRPFIKPLFPISEDVIEIRDLLRNGSFFWTSFSPKRVHAVIRLANPDLGVGGEVDDDSKSDNPVSCDDPVEGAILPPSKGKGIDLGDIEFSVDDSVLPGWDSNLAYGDGSEVLLGQKDEVWSLRDESGIGRRQHGKKLEEAISPPKTINWMVKKDELLREESGYHSERVGYLDEE
ncbi:hypothetical protein Bca52824_034708 [Brassica carinata]|uniref:Uncharacterized protein n=1 Tax=Brassica carinata TaxID=52824 RepID=A0A8X7V3G1_BRACI|nr:hypothetical protein Bca52824_034708 [Brassica carinata]